MAERWTSDKIEAIKGTPLQPNPNMEDQTEVMSPEDPIRIEIETDGGSTPVPVGIPEDPQTRRMKINKGIFADIGYTSGCPRCRAIRTNSKNSQNHSEECRLRVEVELEDA